MSFRLYLSLFKIQDVGKSKLFIGVLQCLVTQSCLILCNPMDYIPSGTSVHGDSPEEYWSGLPCPSPGDLPYPGIEPRSPSLEADSLPSELPGKLYTHTHTHTHTHFIYIYTHFIYIYKLHIYMYTSYIYILSILRKTLDFPKVTCL